MNELIHSQLKRICPTSEAERAQWMDAMAWVASGALAADRRPCGSRRRSSATVVRELRMTSPSQPSQIFFLPGALGRTQLWEPVANMLACPAHKEHIGWPGFGSVPASPSVHGLDDLAEMVLAKIDRPTALVAQSMGGVVAVLAALRKPELITHLVLAATSGGVDVAALGGTDWRPAFHEAHPQLPQWFSAYRVDLSAQLQTIDIPVLLLWGDADPVSPVSVGQRLAALLPKARLKVFTNGDHDLAETHAAEVAPLIDEFLVSS